MSENQNCRICRRKLSGVDAGLVPYQKCTVCGCRICEDCASYTNNKNPQQSSATANAQGEWKCSLCRRKQSDQGSTNLLGANSEMHRVPSMRRMVSTIQYPFLKFAICWCFSCHKVTQSEYSLTALPNERTAW